MKSALLIALLIVSAAALFLGAGCTANHPYTGPVVSTVGITGSYSDRDGNTYGGGVNLGLTTPTPAPIDRSK